MKRPLLSALVCIALVAPAACHGGTAATTSTAEPSQSPQPLASGIVIPSSGPDTTPSNPIVTAALSPEAERGGVIGKTLDPRTMTPTELQFGRPPKLDSTVTYQPDVLVMEHGDTALKSMDSNGFIWHFNANAPQVADIQTGKIVFATERCVGRVLQVQRNGDDIGVVLGPVQITDVIRKAHFVFDQPLDLKSLIAVPAPDLPIVFKQDTPAWASPSGSATPGASPSAQTSFTRHYRLESVTYAMVTPNGTWKPFRVATYDRRGRVHQHLLQPAADRVAQAQPPVAPPVPPQNIPTGVPAPPPNIGEPPPRDVTVNGMTVYPCITGCGGFGVQLKYDQNGLKVYANAVFFLNNPGLHFNVDIDNGIRTVGISLTGAGGFQVRFDMGADQSFAGNIHQIGEIPFDLSIPVFNFAVPIAIHLSQSLNLNTGFSARTSVLSSQITFKACCTLSVGYSNGTWGGSTPNVGIDAPSGNVSGVSVGINSLAFGLRQQLLVGIGAFGFASGPYLALSTGVSALKQASEAMVDCRQATLTMDFSAGVGWTLPKPLVSVVNFLLGALHVAPLPASGSFLEMKPDRFVTYKGSLPKNCAG